MSTIFSLQSQNEAVLHCGKDVGSGWASPAGPQPGNHRPSDLWVGLTWPWASPHGAHAWFDWACPCPGNSHCAHSCPPQPHLGLQRACYLGSLTVLWPFPVYKEFALPCSHDKFIVSNSAERIEHLQLTKQYKSWAVRGSNLRFRVFCQYSTSGSFSSPLHIAQLLTLSLGAPSWFTPVFYCTLQ